MRRMRGWESGLGTRSGYVSISPWSGTLRADEHGFLPASESESERLDLESRSPRLGRACLLYPPSPDRGVSPQYQQYKGEQVFFFPLSFWICSELED
jgi:hypothetical protein